MNTTISNNGLPKFPQATSNSGAGAGTTAASSTGGAATASKTDDQLKLTDSALALQKAGRADDTVAVDTQKVEKLREALANGTYKVDAGRIADRMLAMDQQLGGTDKA
jgi:negative regulator of flagellin synthesis FlgM